MTRQDHALLMKAGKIDAIKEGGLASWRVSNDDGL